MKVLPGAPANSKTKKLKIRLKLTQELSSITPSPMNPRTAAADPPATPALQCTRGAADLELRPLDAIDMAAAIRDPHTSKTAPTSPGFWPPGCEVTSPVTGGRVSSALGEGRQNDRGVDASLVFAACRAVASVDPVSGRGDRRNSAGQERLDRLATLPDQRSTVRRSPTLRQAQLRRSSPSSGGFDSVITPNTSDHGVPALGLLVCYS
jgi:hypothetical protein